jgi:hypothetical protein
MPLLMVSALRRGWEVHAMNMKATLLALAAAAVAAAGALMVLAQQTGAQEPQPTPATARQERRAAFLERVAANLGVDVATLERAIKDARLEAINEALAGGRITDEQAARARQRVESGERVRGARERHRNHDRRAAIRAAIIEQSAAAMGMTPEELRGSLRAGNSIAGAAAARGVALDIVEAAILEAAKAKLDTAVANGRIDQARADEVLAELEARLDELLTRKRTAATAAP